jgi:hypothetical protein
MYMGWRAVCELAPCTYQGRCRTDHKKAANDAKAHEEALEGHTAKIVGCEARASTDDEGGGDEE